MQNAESCMFDFVGSQLITGHDQTRNAELPPKLPRGIKTISTISQFEVDQGKISSGSASQSVGLDRCRCDAGDMMPFAF